MTRHGHGQVHVELQFLGIDRRVHMERVRRCAEQELSQVILESMQGRQLARRLASSRCLIVNSRG